MNTTTRLIMTFKTELDKNVSLSVDNPRTDLTEEEISDAISLCCKGISFISISKIPPP